MVPICWGGGAGCGTHVLGCCGIVLGWRSWLWYCVGVEELAVVLCGGGGAGCGIVWGWRSWLWYCVGVEELAVVLCGGGGAGCGIVWGWRSWLWYCVGVEELHGCGIVLGPVEELAMVPICWGGGAGYAWYPCVGVEELAMHNMVPMCWTINTVYLVTYYTGGDQMVTAEGRGSFPPPMQRDETLCQSLSLFIY